jgi:hypothetical protein
MLKSSLLLRIALPAGALLGAGALPATAGPSMPLIGQATAGIERSDVVRVNGVRRYYRAPAIRHYPARSYPVPPPAAYYAPPPVVYYAPPPVYYAVPPVAVVIGVPTYYAPPIHYAPPVSAYCDRGYYDGGCHDHYYYDRRRYYVGW